MQGPRAALEIVGALRALCDSPGVDVIVLARGGGSFEDLLPFSDEGLVRAVADCPVPIVSAVGHEQDTPLCDLAADVRASTPTAAGRLVVPDLGDLLRRLGATPDLARLEASAGPAPNGLSPRELEVLRLLARGKSNREIATALVMSACIVLVLGRRIARPAIAKALARA